MRYFRRAGVEWRGRETFHATAARGPQGRLSLVAFLAYSAIINGAFVYFLVSVLRSCVMGELIELSYRHFPPLVIEKLIRNGYLRFSDRHKPEAVKRA